MYYSYCSVLLNACLSKAALLSFKMFISECGCLLLSYERTKKQSYLWIPLCWSLCGWAGCDDFVLRLGVRAEP